MAFMFRSVRTRLTLWYTLLLLSTLVVFGILAYYVTGETLSENLDHSLRAEARWMRDFIQPQASKIKPGKRSIDMILNPRTRKPGPIAPTGEDSLAAESDEIWNQIFRHSLQNTKKTYFQFSDARGTILHRSYSLGTDSLAVPDTLRPNNIMLTTVYLNGEPVRVAATRDRNFTYTVGYPIGDLRELLDNLFSIFLILIPGAVAISVFGGLALAKKALQPVDEVAEHRNGHGAHDQDAEHHRTIAGIEHGIVQRAGRALLPELDIAVEQRPLPATRTETEEDRFADAGLCQNAQCETAPSPHT